MVLGITGNIASGKSTVAERFAECGAVLVSADQLAREVVNPGSPTLAAMVDEFGEEILTDGGSLNREVMGQVVFADPDKRKKLESIVHPAIAHLADCRLADLRKSPEDVIVYEAPLLFEASGEGRVDQVLVVTVDPAVQEDRLIRRDGLSATEARQRMEAQWPQAEKIRRADYVIDNSGTLKQMQTEVDSLYHYLVESRA